MDSYSTRQAAKQLGLPLTTLARYVAKGKVPMPKAVRLGGMRVHLWSKADIERVRAILPKIADGRKTRYQSQGKKQTRKKSKG
jgi:predicted DNA-binding transcriptional regulator AlpA